MTTTENTRPLGSSAQAKTLSSRPDPCLTGEVLIVGGGIGGLALGLALQRAGIAAVICERAAELREVGTGILLTPNASWVLERLGVLEKIREGAHVARRWGILDRDGRVLQTLAFGNGRTPSLNLARAALQTALAEALRPETLRLDHDACSFAEEAGKIAVSFANGKRMLAELAVGADGGKSAVRRELFPGRPPTVHGYIGWRALVRDVPDGWRDGLVTESWGEGCRFGIAPIAADRTYWYATENAPRGWQRPPGGAKGHLLERFRGWHAPIARLIEATEEEAILLNEMAEHEVLQRWRNGRATLLGDAAHLMTPNLGQGAAMALEDAWVLAQSLAERGIGEAALEDYERRRIGRTRAIVWRSRQVGRLIQIEHPIAWRMRNALLRCLPDAIGRGTLKSVFDFRV